MRLIDADYLKEQIDYNWEYVNPKLNVCNVLRIIDNAPTVAFPFEICGNTCQIVRPQGEWVLNEDENPECPFCHHSFTYWGNFCGNCGADMR